MGERMTDEEAARIVANPPTCAGILVDAPAGRMFRDWQRARSAEATLTAERDAAVKRAEEAERRFREAMLKKADDLARLLATVASLRAELADARHELEEAEAVKDDDDAAGLEALETERRLRSELERVRGALEAIAESHDTGRHDGLPEECPAHDADVMWALARAALSPAPEPSPVRETVAPTGRSDTDAKRGLYEKYRVERVDGSDLPGKRHEHCRYYVLDLTHDQFSMPALRAYAEACEAQFPLLARDLRALSHAPADVVRPQRAEVMAASAAVVARAQAIEAALPEGEEFYEDWCDDCRSWDCRCKEESR